MKFKPYLCYWVISAPIMILGIYCLASQLTAPDVFGGSYSGYVGGMWRGDEGMNIHDTPPVKYAEDVAGLILPYLFITIGLCLGVAGYRHKKSEKVALADSSLAEVNANTVWPPPVKRR